MLLLWHVSRFSKEASRCRIEQRAISPSMNHRVPFHVCLIVEGGMAPSIGTETIGVVAELRARSMPQE